jgi:hypothetical protein
MQYHTHQNNYDLDDEDYNFDPLPTNTKKPIASMSVSSGASVSAHKTSMLK